MSDDVIVVTGGSGFVGSAVIRHLIRESEASVVNVDALTYAATPASLAEVEGHARYRFERIDIRSAPELERVFSAYRPTAVLHLAAETHVDRSITDPRIFVETNVVGTAILLESTCRYWRSLPPGAPFRFHHVSTDEVFGSLGPTGSLPRGLALSPQFALRGQQGGRRPSRAGLAQDVWLADHHQQLFEQLRPLPIS